MSPDFQRLLKLFRKGLVSLENSLFQKVRQGILGKRLGSIGRGDEKVPGFGQETFCPLQNIVKGLNWAKETFFIIGTHQ